MVLLISDPLETSMWDGGGRRCTGRTRDDLDSLRFENAPSLEHSPWFETGSLYRWQYPALRSWSSFRSGRYARMRLRDRRPSRKTSPVKSRTLLRRTPLPHHSCGNAFPSRRPPSQPHPALASVSSGFIMAFISWRCRSFSLLCCLSVCYLLVANDIPLSSSVVGLFSLGLESFSPRNELWGCRKTVMRTSGRLLLLLER